MLRRVGLQRLPTYKDHFILSDLLPEEKLSHVRIVWYTGSCLERVRGVLECLILVNVLTL